MKYDFVIFGGTGQQGRICARDLLESGYSTLLIGRDSSGIKNILKNKRSKFMTVDLRNQKAIVKAIKISKAKIVINCAELTFNIPIMKACLETKKSCIDLGGLHEITKKQFKLHRAFKKRGIINITGCGSTPGILNVLTAHAVENFDSIKTINLGFAWDSNIKKFVVPYSIQSIFNEFTEPPITFHNGKFIKETRLRCQGTFDFKGIGKQKVYCIVHSEVYTFAKYFKHLGLKNINYMAGFPEHSLNKIRNLIDLGFNSKNPIIINDKKIVPLDFTLKVLKNTRFPKGYKEIENLWVDIYGKKDGKEKKTTINCIVKTLPDWQEAGSNIDTGRTASIISQMLFKGLIKQKGVFGPEAVIPHTEFIKELGKRKMYVFLNKKRIN